MKALIPLAALIALSAAPAPADAASFSCTTPATLNAAEYRICNNFLLGRLDERLDYWYGQALNRARYFGDAWRIRSAQRDWVATRNDCGSGFWCIQRAYSQRIRELKNYAEHV